MSRRGTIAILVGLVILVLVSGCVSRVSREASESSGEVTLTVAAASDLIPAFERIGATFNEQTPYTVQFTFGSSGLLAQQVESGAPIDVYVSANEEYVDELNEKGLLIEDTVQAYALGRIVLWSLNEDFGSLPDVESLNTPDINRIAIGNPDHAPYGVAGREAIQSAGIWDEVQDRLVFGGNIRETMQYAETGNVDVAIIALSLALASDEGYWTLIPASEHDPIVQTLGIVASTVHETAARTFVDHVTDARGRAILADYGFEFPDEDVE
jgi:molybdate transport system substrate-binding protein